MFGRRARFALTLAVALAAGPVAALAGPAKVGDPAPPFSLVTLDGQTVKLSDLRGQVVVLNYWATWCAPCRNEMPMFDIYLRHHADQGLRIFSVTVGDVPAYRLKPLSKVLTFPLITRMHGGGYGTLKNAVPTSYVIDRAGVLRLAQAGSFDNDGFDAVIAPLLAEPAPVPAPTATIAAGG